MPFTWNETLSVGFKEIDNQHKELFKRIDELINAMKQGKGKDEVSKTVKFLEDYTVSHFKMEENYMQIYKYPDMAYHKTQHAGLVSDLQKIKRSIDTEGISSLITINLQKQLEEWLINHIGKNDKALGAFIKERVK